MTSEQLIKEHLPLIKHIALNFYQSSFEDLLQAGAIGVLKAYKKFRQNGNTKFSTYAYDYIFGEMYDFVMKDRKIKISKDLVRLAKKVELAKNMLSLKENRVPNYEELGSFLQMTPFEIKEALDVHQKFISLDDTLEEERSLYETIPIPEKVSLEDKIFLQEGIEQLSKSEQKMGKKLTIRYIETKKDVIGLMQEALKILRK